MPRHRRPRRAALLLLLSLSVPAATGVARGQWLTLSSVAIATVPAAVPDAAAPAEAPPNEGLGAVPTVEAAEAPSPEVFLAADLRDGRVSRGFVRQRVLHFTFDDGPRLETTPRLLEHLDRHGVKATFFVVARQIDGTSPRKRAQAALLQRMAADGHTIGFHGVDHSSLLELAPEQIEQQLRHGEQVFTRVLGARPWLFRPPYGAHDEVSDQLLAERGYTQLLWNTTVEANSPRQAEAVAENFVRSLDIRERHPRGRGGMVLGHDTHLWVVDAFPAMMRELQRRNCELLASGEALWDVVDDPRLFHTPRGAAGPSRQAGTHVMDSAVHAERQQRLRAAAEVYCG